MAVYTSVSDEALSAYLSGYDLGAPLAFKGIAEGVENSNYYLETETGRYILTLFEKRASPADLPYFMSLKRHLARQGFACPQPIEDKKGKMLKTLSGRPSVIVSFLEGLSPKRPNAGQCFELGQALARMHKALEGFDGRRKNALGPSSWASLWAGRAPDADALQSGLSSLINADLAQLQAMDLCSPALPHGTIHADLFPDNAFFLGERFSGAIDFYFACSGALVFDLAICLNAWAFDSRGAYNFTNGKNLIAGYQKVRPLVDAELSSLPMQAKGAAMRFFLTRLVDWTETPDDALVKPKDPLDYAARLAFHRKAKSATDYGA